MNKTGRWLGPLSGILFVAAVAVSNSIFSGIDAEPSNSGSTMFAQLQANADDIGFAAYIDVLGLGFLLIFLGHLRTKLRSQNAGWAADGLLAGGVALVGALTVLTAVNLAGGVAGENGHAEVARVVVDFLWESSYLFTPGLLAFGIAAAVASFSNRALPLWLGVLALLVILGALMPWLGILVFAAWVLAASIVELVSPSRLPAAVTST